MISVSSTHKLCSGPYPSHLTKNCFLPLRLRSLTIRSMLYVSESSGASDASARTDWSMFDSWTGLWSAVASFGNSSSGIGESSGASILGGTTGREYDAERKLVPRSDNNVRGAP